MTEARTPAVSTVRIVTWQRSTTKIMTCIHLPLQVQPSSYWHNSVIIAWCAMFGRTPSNGTWLTSTAEEPSELSHGPSLDLIAYDTLLLRSTVNVSCAVPTTYNISAGVGMEPLRTDEASQQEPGGPTDDIMNAETQLISQPSMPGPEGEHSTSQRQAQESKPPSDSSVAGHDQLDGMSEPKSKRQALGGRRRKGK